MAFGLSGCDGSGHNMDSDNPRRASFIAACEIQPSNLRIEKRSRGRVTASDYCACAYDKTMKGLSDIEQRAAFFYLMSMAGGETDALSSLEGLDIADAASAIGPASEAIGKIRNRCPQG